MCVCVRWDFSIRLITQKTPTALNGNTHPTTKISIRLESHNIIIYRKLRPCTNNHLIEFVWRIYLKLFLSNDTTNGKRESGCVYIIYCIPSSYRYKHFNLYLHANTLNILIVNGLITTTVSI